VVSILIASVRLILLAPLLYCLTSSSDLYRWTALGLFVAISLSDGLGGGTSRNGAMLDLVTDRLLTLALVTGLIVAGELKGPFVFAGAAFVARDLAVASFGQATGRLGAVTTWIERARLSLQFGAFMLLLAPPFLSHGGPGQYEFGRWALTAAAALVVVTTLRYAMLAARPVRPTAQPVPTS
jgi:phosphatidylglycerophosphate synthase